jgi:hypothetical protein
MNKPTAPDASSDRLFDKKNIQPSVSLTGLQRHHSPIRTCCRIPIPCSTVTALSRCSCPRLVGRHPPSPPHLSAVSRLPPSPPQFTDHRAALVRRTRLTASVPLRRHLEPRSAPLPLFLSTKLGPHPPSTTASSDADEIGQGQRRPPLLALVVPSRALGWFPRAKGTHEARPVLVVLAHYRSVPAPTPRPESTGPGLSLPLYVPNICFKCFRRYQRYVASVLYLPY